MKTVYKQILSLFKVFTNSHAPVFNLSLQFNNVPFAIFNASSHERIIYLQLKIHFMKSMKLLLLLVIICQFMYSCSKPKYMDTIKVQGMVYDATNHKPIANATVFLLIDNPNCLTCPGKTMQIFTTSSNGLYSFTFTQDISASSTYYVTTRANNFFDPQDVGVDLGHDNLNKDLPLNPMAFIRYNITLTSVNSEIRYGIYGGHWPGQYLSYGNHNNIIDIEDGNKYNKLFYIYDNKGDTIKKDTLIFCPEFDTTIVKLHF